MRSGEVVERIVWRVLFGTVMLASANAKAATVDMFDGHWRYSLTPDGWLPDIKASSASMCLQGGAAVRKFTPIRTAIFPTSSWSR